MSCYKIRQKSGEPSQKMVNNKVVIPAVIWKLKKWLAFFSNLFFLTKIIYNIFRWCILIRNFRLVKVDYKYCDYLRKFDNKVSYNAGIKELRPFIGILFVVDGIEYYAPLSSPKL